MSQKRNKQIRYDARKAEEAAREALKKNKGIGAGALRNKLLAGLLLVLMLAAMSCEMGMGKEEENPGPGSGQGVGQGNNGGNDNDGQDNQQRDLKNHYSEYENFNPADYPIINETGKPDLDQEFAELRDFIWLMYAEKEDVGEWTANYVKTNKIKTILSDGNGGWAWIRPNHLDRLYVNTDAFYEILSFVKDAGGGPNRFLYDFITHETMHLVQYKSGVFNLMKGMRPDICAAIEMLKEFLAWFYTETRDSGTIITADMKNAIETQSGYMISATDPWNDQNQILHTPWFNNELNGYMQYAITSVSGSAMTPPLRQASKEDMLEIARAMLACRDPKMAGVTDDALWTVFDALCKAAVGNSKYIRFGEGGYASNAVNRDSFNAFQDLIAEWDAEYAAQSRSVEQTTQSVSPSTSMKIATAELQTRNTTIDWKSNMLAWNGKKR